jgi:hypothetical protein
MAEIMEEDLLTRETKVQRLKTLFLQSTPQSLPILLKAISSTHLNGYFTIESELNPGAQTAISKRIPEIISCEINQNCEQTRAADLDRACAFKGRCAASDIEDHWRFYELSPQQAQDLESQRIAMIKLIDARDFSALRFVKRQSIKQADADFDPESYSPNYNCK